MSVAGMVRVPAPAGVKGEKMADISENKIMQKKTTTTNEQNKTKTSRLIIWHDFVIEQTCF